jgi:ATP-dependent DNA helicase DinG
VLTSATLATRTARQGDHREYAEAGFAHVMSNLGIDDAHTLQLGSPFDYARQARVVVDLSMPNPNAPSRGSDPAGRDYNGALAARVLHHIQATRGGAFVLFTSFGTLYAVADRLRAQLEGEGMPVFVQGRDGSRQHILKQFVENENAVLFGAASFWQGVDVRGERLRNVIITRLPFEPPDRPLTQARLERIEDAGGNPFMHDSLPRAIIRFKQGFGRLIRSKTDTGRVVVLDPRIRTARYGKLFLDALPEGVAIEEVRPGALADDF